MTTCLEKELFMRLTLRVFREYYQILCVCPFPYGIEGGMWDVIVFIPGHCLSIYSEHQRVNGVVGWCDGAG